MEHFKEKMALNAHLLQILILLTSERCHSVTVQNNPVNPVKYTFRNNLNNHNGDIVETIDKKEYDPWKIFKQYSEFVSSNGKKVDMSKLTMVPPKRADPASSLNAPDKIIIPIPPNINDKVYVPWQFLSKFDKKVLNQTPNTGELKKKSWRRTKSGLKPNFPSKKRFLEVLQIVKFDHVSCDTSSGLQGTCLHEYECKSLGGTGKTSCANGFGVCCIILLGCDSQTSPDMGWFTNPEFPSPNTDRLSCSITIEKYSEDVEQIRLDFKNFELLPPINGACKSDQFIISGQNVNNVIPVLCGVNTGQHLYIDVSDTDGPINIAIQTEEPDLRLFAIKITQLTPSDDYIAPSGCLQYYTDMTGIIESFNYRDYSEIAIKRSPSYFNNLNYAICIEKAPKTCQLAYTNIGQMQILNYDSDGRPITTIGEAGVEIFNCPHDWLLIAATRLCGERFNDGTVQQDLTKNAPVIDDNAGPAIIRFRSDETYIGRGFKLKYEQISCPKE